VKLLLLSGTSDLGSRKKKLKRALAPHDDASCAHTCCQPAADCSVSHFAACRQQNHSHNHELLMLVGSKYFGVERIQGEGEDNLVPEQGSECKYETYRPLQRGKGGCVEGSASVLNQ
jgi:hypothetical protein